LRGANHQRSQGTPGDVLGVGHGDAREEPHSPRAPSNRVCLAPGAPLPRRRADRRTADLR
ncbi:unnamed protein product, partial [Durusdinium trenchii]